jgi:hypothetical protein
MDAKNSQPEKLAISPWGKKLQPFQEASAADLSQPRVLRICCFEWVQVWDPLVKCVR